MDFRRVFAYLDLMFIVCFHSSKGGFLGGTINWFKISNTNKMRLTYRLSWEKGKGPCGPGCNMSNLALTGATLSPVVASLHWRQVIGNVTTNVSDVNYVVTSVSISDVNGWEQGEMSVTLADIRTPFQFSLSGVPWVLPINVSGPALGVLQTSVHTEIRSDTGRSNTSPLVSLPPYIGVGYNCSSEVRLPVEDPDGDQFRCRWAITTECGHACTNMPQKSVWLDQDQCSLKVLAFPQAGVQPGAIYRLALTVEDYVMHNITIGSKDIENRTGISQIPLQFTLRISPEVCNITGDFRFVRPTPPNLTRAAYTPTDLAFGHKPVDTSFYIHSSPNKSVQFMVSGPQSLVYRYLPDDQQTALNRSDVTRIGLYWTPSRQQIGTQQICVWGVSDTWVTVGPRCITEIVGDTDNCMTSVTCHNNGTCVNVYALPNETCVCQPGFRGSDCSHKLVCADSPCQNKGSCVQTSTGLKCDCPKGFFGRFCELKKSRCTSSPCQNNGTCINRYNDHLCICSPAFTGTECQSSIHSQKTSNNENSRSFLLWIILTVLVSMTVMFVIILMAAVCTQKKNSKRRRSPLSKNNKVSPLEQAESK